MAKRIDYKGVLWDYLQYVLKDASNLKQAQDRAWRVLGTLTGTNTALPQEKDNGPT